MTSFWPMTYFSHKIFPRASACHCVTINNLATCIACLITIITTRKRHFSFFRWLRFRHLGHSNELHMFSSPFVEKFVPIHMCQKSRQSANRHGYLTSASVGGAVTLCSTNSDASGATSFVKISDIENEARAWTVFRVCDARSLPIIVRIGNDTFLYGNSIKSLSFENFFKWIINWKEFLAS